MRGVTCRQRAGEVGMPWTSTTGWPSPCSSQRTGVPSIVIVLLCTRSLLIVQVGS